MAKRLKIDPQMQVNVQVLGISTTLKDYRIAQIANHALGLNLHRLQNLQVYQEKTQELSEHSIYQSEDELNRRSFNLVQNRSQSLNAISLNPSMDFLILIHGKVKAAEVKLWLTNLRKVQGILLAQELVSAKIKGLEGLLTDIEMHLMEIRMKAREKPDIPWETGN